MALWQYCRETAHKAAVFLNSALCCSFEVICQCAGSATVKQSVHSKAEDSLFGASLFAGTAACTTILHGFYWQVMGRAAQCRKVCQTDACFGKSSSFATNARLKSRVHPKYIEVPCSPYAPQERLVAALCLTQCLPLAFPFLLPAL